MGDLDEDTLMIEDGEDVNKQLLMIDLPKN